MDATTQVERHEKAIRLLNAIAECERLMNSHRESMSKAGDIGKVWFYGRWETNKKIKDRLQKYYNKSFKI